MLELEFVRKGDQYEIGVNGTPSHSVTAAQLLQPLNIEGLEDLTTSLIAYGQRLYQLVFRDGTPAQAAVTHTTDGPQRIFLVFDEHQELQAIPWEYLHDGTRFLATRHHLLRALPARTRRAWNHPNSPLKIYALLADPVMTANTPIAINKAWDDLLVAIRDRQGVYLERVLPPTLNRLRERLDPAAFNVVHLLCHGNVSNEGQGQAVLALQDNFGNEILTPADRIVDTLQGRAALVVLNACMSATAGAHALSNLAYALVRDAVPYALGMQFVMAEAASFILSRTLYTELTKGGSVEEAVRQARNSILDAHEIPEAAFWAGVPALYTSLEGATAPVVVLAEQPPTVTPDPGLLFQRQQLSELATSDVLIGRGSKLVEVATALQRERDRRSRFITLHGIGGIGKTSLAAEAAQRSAWAFEHRVLGLSLEVLPTSDTFIGRLAEYYLGLQNIDPTWDPETRRDRVIARVRATPSILLLDNLETVLDAAHPEDADLAPDPNAQQLESIILNLAGGATAILTTSRVRTSFEGEQVIEVEGLSKQDGASLFLRQLSRRRDDVSRDEAEALSERLNGHPLALRLLASEFDRDHRAFADFWREIDAELVEAENRAALKNLRDPERQKTLIGCIDYSVRRLPGELRDALRSLFVFRGAFVPQTAAAVLADPAAETILQVLVDRSLLTYREEVGLDQETLFRLPLYSLHPMVHWYIDWALEKPEPQTMQRYSVAMATLTAEVSATYWQRRVSRRVIDVSLEDMLVAAASLDTRTQGVHLHHLGLVFFYRRDFRRALELYQQALDSLRQVDDPREVAVTLHSMGDVYRLQRDFRRALELYQQALDSLRQVDDPREVAVTLHSMGDVYSEQRDFRRALELYQQALDLKRQVDDPREVAVTLGMMAQAYLGDGQPELAVRSLWEAYQIIVRVNDRHTAQAMAETFRLIKRMLGKEQFDAIWQQVTTQPQPDWLAQADAEGEEGEDSELQVMMKVIIEFLQTPDWQAARQFLEAHQDILFSEKVEEILEVNIQDARETGQHEYAQMLISHLELIRRARRDGITAAFAELEQRGEHSAQLMNAIRAFVNADDRQARRLAWEQHHEALCDPEVRDIFELNIQQAQQAGDQALLSRLMADRDLINRACQEGIEAALADWEPVAAVDGQTTPPSLPTEIVALAAHNTLAVLTTARSHLSEWRTQLVQIRNAAVTAGDAPGVTFCEALIALLDADGDATALKPELSGIQWDVWQQLIAALDSWKNKGTSNSAPDQSRSEDR